MMARRADSIRGIAIREYVLPNLEDGSVRFTVAEIHQKVRERLGWNIQQQHVRGALTAKGPLWAYGIDWVQQDGPSTQYQEIYWTWRSAEEVRQQVHYLPRIG